MQVPFARPYLTGEEGEAVAKVISTGWVSQGPQVQAFEQAFAQRVGAADAVATTSCTTALQLALHGIGIGPGDEVIVPSLSFIATANSVWMCGARPAFADIDPRTYNLDPAAAERAITERTRAIMPVHQVGLPADIDALLELSQRYGLALVEDAACAIGASYKGRPVGSLSELACFSLHPRKVITTGEGGMIAVQDRELAARLRRLRQHGMSVSDLARHSTQQVVIETYPEPGFNYRMTDMQAALGLCQLEVLDHVLERRRVLAERYNAAIEGIPGLEPPYDPPYAERTWQSYCVRVLPSAAVGRTELMQRLLADGIPTRRGVMAIHEEQAYAGVRQELEHTEAAARDVVMLPLFPDLTEGQQDYVIERLAAHVVALAA
jgi:perosamine synthetase